MNEHRLERELFANILKKLLVVDVGDECPDDVEITLKVPAKVIKEGNKLLARG